MQSNRKIWFPAKKYGWGWGPPCAWQGWVVLLLWLTVFIGGAETIFRPDHGWVKFFSFEGVMVVLLLAVCFWKGEKPKWRWGNK